MYRKNKPSKGNVALEGLLKKTKQLLICIISSLCQSTTKMHFFSDQYELKTHCNHKISYLNFVSVLICWALCKQPSVLEGCMQEGVCMCVTRFENVFIWNFLSVILSKTFMNSGTIGNHAVDNGDVFVCTAFIYSSENFLGQRVASSY